MSTSDTPIHSFVYRLKSRKTGMTIAIGGRIRRDRNQNARCLPPVRNRAIE